MMIIFIASDRSCDKQGRVCEQERGRVREGGGREGEAPSCKCWLLLRLALTTADVWLPSWAVYLLIDQFKFARLLTDRLAGTFTWIKTKKEFIFWHYVASREEYFFNYCSTTVQQPRPLQSASFSLLRFNYNIRAHCNCNSICLWVRP